MTQNEILLFFENYKRGSYTRITKQSEKNGFKKITSLVCRFVNYYNIKSVKDRGATMPNPRPYEIQIIPHILKLNTNTNNLLLCVYLTNHHKTHTKYYYNDIEITAAEYYTGINEKPREYHETQLFNFKAAEVVALGV